MKNKIVIFNMLIITLAMVVLLCVGISSNRKSHYDEAEKKIVEISTICVNNIDVDTPTKLAENTPDDIRITIMDSTGVVLADSAEQNIVGESHADREEVVSAISGTPKTATRKSSTTSKQTMYYAVKTESCYIVRVAIPVESVEKYVSQTVPVMIFVLLVALLVAYGAGIVATNSILEPLKEIKNNLNDVSDGTYREKIPSSSDKDVNTIMTEINGISEKLQYSIKETSDEKERLGYILSNISDGIIVTDDDGTITEINDVAAEIFDIYEVKGKNFAILMTEKKLLDAVVDGEEDKTSFETEIEGRNFIATVKKLKSGRVVVLTDITAVKNSEKMRSEFFANASHELKTPLTAIKGFNDIISISTKEEQTAMLSAKIDKEVSRIVTLINDMLGLSKLESCKIENTEEINLTSIAEEVKESLITVADKNGVKIEITGNGIVEMEREHAVELVKNLVENSVRYNRKGGWVKVNTESKEGQVIFSVTDNGIGIEEEHQQRIFERFYRVSKSRSKKTGGTGLGLAIVKHICNMYNAELSLTSKYGEGTQIKVSFTK